MVIIRILNLCTALFHHHSLLCPPSRLLLGGGWRISKTKIKKFPKIKKNILRGSSCSKAVRGQFLSVQKSTLTMEELLDQLIKKAANETEEAHRHYIAALNGLAGECRGASEGYLFFYIYRVFKKNYLNSKERKFYFLFFHNTLYSSVIWQQHALRS